MSRLNHKTLMAWYQRPDAVRQGCFYQCDIETWMVPDGANFNLMHQMRHLATLMPDDVWVLEWTKEISIRDALRLTHAIGIYVRRDRTRHRNKLQTTRVAAKRSYGGESYPFTPGLRIWNGEFLNWEIAVDQVRRTDRKKAKELDKLIVEPLKKLTTSMIRLEAVELARTHRFPEHLLEQIQPTADHAQAFLNYAMRWRYRTDESQQAMLQATARGFRIFRKRLYEHHGAVYYQPVNQ